MASDKQNPSSTDCDASPSEQPGLMARLMGDVALCLSVLTRLPVSSVWLTRDHVRPLGRAVWAFAPVGIIVGSMGGISLWAASNFGLHPLTCALIALGVIAMATGALHDDGLADLVDGFGGGTDAKAKLAIMKDSRIGGFGVLALIFSVGLKVSALATLLGPGMAAATLVAAATLSRAAMPLIALALEPARKDGLGTMMGKPCKLQVGIGLGLALVVCLICLPLKGALLGFVIALAGVALLAVLTQRQIGGFTGDVLGAAQSVAEILFLLVAAGTTQWY